MRNVLLIVAFALGAILLQTTLLHSELLGTVVPDIMLILCVYLGLRHQNVGGVVGAFLLGYVLDAFSGTDVGLNAFAMTSVFLIVYLMSRRLWIEGGLASAVVVLAAAVVKVLVLAGLAAAFSGGPSLAAVRSSLVGGTLAAAAAPFVFGALERSKRWLQPQTSPLG
jgi:rod shape-determining protein MreD